MKLLEIAVFNLPIAIVEEEFFALVYVLQRYKPYSHLPPSLNWWKQGHISPLRCMIDELPHCMI